MKATIYRSTIALILTAASLTTSGKTAEPIDRYALIGRNSPLVTTVDTLSSLTVGNGAFAFTVDVTGMQSLPQTYKNGVPLGTQSQWGWHSFANPDSLRHDETLREYDFGHGHKELYSTEIKDDERGKAASAWYRANPHRLHLGTIGFDFGVPEEEAARGLHGIRQHLDLWNGAIDSRFTFNDTAYHVVTACHPHADIVAVTIVSQAHTPVVIRFPYPTGGHSDDACDWNADDKHSSHIEEINDSGAVIRHVIDSTTYYLTVRWTGRACLSSHSPNRFGITYDSDSLALAFHFTPFDPANAENMADNVPDNATQACVDTAGNNLLRPINNGIPPCPILNSPVPDVYAAAAGWWNKYWKEGAAVDFSACTDPRAAELERRVVLSQYLLAVQCAGDTPPQETGLTYNSWFGKFHLEMIWWHQAHFALWNRPQMLARSLNWYAACALPKAKEIARRQGFSGARWMKMTDPWAGEAPSKVGSFLIWQQPHVIYLAELLRRCCPDDTTIVSTYGDLVEQTAEFMGQFATFDSAGQRYVLKGIIPAQETLKAAETVNPPLELSYWHFGLSTAQQWRSLRGMERNALWDDVTGRLSPLSFNSDSLYLAAESAKDTYTNIQYTSDHPAVLGAVGMLPLCRRLVDMAVMRKTLLWVRDNWNWNKTWGWDYPLTAMCATRLGERQLAVESLLMSRRTNTFLPNGHNYQDGRLRIYLPGNGGLLTAIALMCAGWDGCEEINPGFPDDGTWNVRWEGLMPLP